MAWLLGRPWSWRYEADVEFGPLTPGADGITSVPLTVVGPMTGFVKRGWFRTEERSAI